MYLCITESKKKSGAEDETPQFEKHKVFLYKEDFAHFTEGLEDVINFVKAQVGTIEEREEWKPEKAEDASEAEPEEKPAEEKRGFLGRFLKN